MDEMELVERLARSARGAATPSVDVVDRVMRRLGREVVPWANGRFWSLAAGLSTVAAATLLLAIRSLAAFEDLFVQVLSIAKAVFS
jgi:hypothetical protein